MEKFVQEHPDLEMAQKDSNSLNEAIRGAVQLWGDYIKPGAPFEINISGKLRKNIHIQLHSEDLTGQTLLVLLNDARTEIYDLLKTDSFRRFQCTDIYKSFVKEMRDQWIEAEAWKSSTHKFTM